MPSAPPPPDQLRVPVLVRLQGLTALSTAEVQELREVVVSGALTSGVRHLGAEVEVGPVAADPEPPRGAPPHSCFVIAATVVLPTYDVPAARGQVRSAINRLQAPLAGVLPAHQTRRGIPVGVTWHGTDDNELEARRVSLGFAAQVRTSTQIEVAVLDDLGRHCRQVLQTRSAGRNATVNYRGVDATQLASGPVPRGGIAAAYLLGFVAVMDAESWRHAQQSMAALGRRHLSGPAVPPGRPWLLEVRWISPKAPRPARPGEGAEQAHSAGRDGPAGRTAPVAGPVPGRAQG